MKKNLSLFILTCFVFNFCVPPSYAQPVSLALFNLPQPGTRLVPAPAFTPVVMRGLMIYPDNPLKFDFVIDKGDQSLSEEEFKNESTKLVRYFLAALTVPEKDMWVNLSSQDKNRMTPDNFGRTEMGRDLLVQDYILKKLIASLIYPENEAGKEFWNRVYTKIHERFGVTEIPLNIFNKVWIVPDKESIYEHSKGALIVNGRLKVLLDEDSVTATTQSQMIREILIPEIEREVNEGKTFAQLRQIYFSMILASWYKKTFKESFLGKVYVDQNKTEDVDSADKSENQKIYEKYLADFKQGAYDYIKEDDHPEAEEVVTKKYISCGVTLEQASVAMTAAYPEETHQIVDQLLQRGSIATYIFDGGKSTSSNAAILGESRIQEISDSVSSIVSTSASVANTNGATELSRGEFVNRIVMGILALRDPGTGLVPSHYGHPELESLGFLYDEAFFALALYASGKQAEAEKILDYVAARLKIPLAEIKAGANAEGIYGILNLLKNVSRNNKAVLGLLNGMDITSRVRQGHGALEYKTTPGPLSIFGLVLLKVDKDKYLDSALILGETLLALQREDGGIYDGDRLPDQVHTEPHVDAADFFYELYLTTNDSKWKIAAEAGWQWFRGNVYNVESGTIDQGNGNLGRVKTFATDVYSWTMAGHYGDTLSPDEIIRLSDHMLRKSLTRVYVPVPDGTTRDLILVDFSDSISEEIKKVRKGLHPMGTVEWTGGVILALQKNAVRLWNTDDSRYQEKAREYKAIANILINECLKSFYSLSALKGGIISFYATGQNVETGFDWKTPYFYVKNANIVVQGGSTVSSWPILPILGSNPFILNDDYKVTLDKIEIFDKDQQRAQTFIDEIVAGERTYHETVPSSIADDAPKMVELKSYNKKVWDAFNQKDYEEVISRAMDVINETEWVRIAIRQQEVKAKAVGGLIDYPWGTPSSVVPEIEAAIWKYPLLNEVGMSMWALAVSNFELGRKDEAKKWMKRIITEVPLHQIATGKWIKKEDPLFNQLSTPVVDGKKLLVTGYWNALVSWEWNPGNSSSTSTILKI